MSGSLVKLIDNALLPALFVIFGKFGGLFFVAYLFNIELAVLADPVGFLLNVTTLASTKDILLLSSYSDMIMFLLVTLGFVWVLINSIYLHDTHISVKTISNLARLNLLSLVKSSYELYHKAAIWFIFIWLANLAIAVNVVLGRTYVWLLIITTIFSIALSVALFRDVIKELELGKKRILKGAI